MPYIAGISLQVTVADHKPVNNTVNKVEKASGILFCNDPNASGCPASPEC